MTVTDTTIVPEVTDPEYDKSVAHIVPPDRDRHGNVTKQGVAKVTEARVLGTPVEALCGFVWVPNKDPQNLPLCEKCKALAGELAQNPGSA